jgi:ubiquinone biosynthesis protein
MPPFPQAEAERAVAGRAGQPLADLFASFGAPVAAASIAQVHRAEVVTDGGVRAVAVKVLRPEVERRFKVDLDAFSFVARNAEKMSAEARRLRLIEGGRDAAPVGRARDGSAFRGGRRCRRWRRTPATIPTSASQRWIGTAPRAMCSRSNGSTRRHCPTAPLLESGGLDLKRLARAVIQTFLRHALRDGFFHADMHPGNLFVDDAGQLVAVDFGIMGRLGAKERRFLAEILLGFITRNYHRTAEVHFEAGYVPPHHSVASFAQAIRAIGEPIHNRVAEEISMAKIVHAAVRGHRHVRHAHPSRASAAAETMVVVEGVARSLDPKLDMWTVAEPVVREWIERNLGPAGRLEDAAEGRSRSAASSAMRRSCWRAARCWLSSSTPSPATG